MFNPGQRLFDFRKCLRVFAKSPKNVVYYKMTLIVSTHQYSCRELRTVHFKVYLFNCVDFVTQYNLLNYRLEKFFRSEKRIWREYHGNRSVSEINNLRLTNRLRTLRDLEEHFINLPLFAQFVLVCPLIVFRLLFSFFEILTIIKIARCSPWITHYEYALIIVRTSTENTYSISNWTHTRRISAPN